MWQLVHTLSFQPGHETLFRSLSDLVALNIGQIGENLALGSATVVKAAEDESICGLCHPRYQIILKAVLTFFELWKKKKDLKKTAFAVPGRLEMCNMADMLHSSHSKAILKVQWFLKLQFAKSQGGLSVDKYHYWYSMTIYLTPRFCYDRPRCLSTYYRIGSNTY